jgi:tRNA 2-thiouridine synthesizing protein B
MLYMVNKSPLMTNNLETCLTIAPAGDPILLYEDGVYGAMAGNRLAEQVEAALSRHPIYALTADLEARGIKRLVEGVQVVDYDGFVGLVEAHDVVPWI